MALLFYNNYENDPALRYACGSPSLRLQKKTETLFRLIPPSDTGIDFVNEITESDTFNILTEEYIYNGGGVGRF